jgi:hypothetical protein
MLYILRLTNGSSVVVLSDDERSARQAALDLNLEGDAEIASIRPLNQFAVQLSPTEDGSLEAEHWDSSTLDDILSREYPLMEEALRHANARPFVKPAGASGLSLAALKSWHEKNNEIIREAIRLERERLATPASAEKEATQTISGARLKSKSMRVGAHPQRH